CVYRTITHHLRRRRPRCPRPPPPRVAVLARGHSSHPTRERASAAMRWRDVLRLQPARGARGLTAPRASGAWVEWRKTPRLGRRTPSPARIRIRAAHAVASGAPPVAGLVWTAAVVAAMPSHPPAEYDTLGVPFSYTGRYAPSEPHNSRLAPGAA